MDMDAHQRFFAAWSSFYEETPLFAWLLHRQQRAAVEALAPRPGERVLDLSCGTGRGLGLLTEAGARAVGLDVSGQMLVRALEAGRREPLVWADATRLPFRSASFDGLLCTNAFHHYPDPPRALAEIRRVLRPGGRAALVDPRLDSVLSRLTIFGGEALIFSMPVHLHTQDGWRALCQQAGFADARVEPLATFPLPATSLLVVAQA
jgi:ubiquinone/menaquinone biosynthesis C-methylase UbiE